MPKVAFFYANGTATEDPTSLQSVIKAVLSTGKMPVTQTRTVAGLRGRTAAWKDITPQNDPFCQLLDPDIFDAMKIGYPAAQFPMDASIADGKARTIAAIKALPLGQPFMLGGFSQGAVVMSSILAELRSGSLTSRASSFLGFVGFGNPCRQLNYRGEVGGTWSGSWGTSGSTSGGHGAFPASGPWPRLTNCDPTKWIEFVDHFDVFAACGDTTLEQAWTAAVAAGSQLSSGDLANALANAWTHLNTFNTVNAQIPTFTFTDAAGASFSVTGGGHVAYPWRPPPGNPDNGLTSYQIAIKWLESKANSWATAPISLPATPASTATAGWSTNLITPAA